MPAMMVGAIILIKSLYSLITTGKGQPNPKKAALIKNSLKN
jgi:hypothetical protein